MPLRCQSRAKGARGGDHSKSGTLGTLAEIYGENGGSRDTQTGVRVAPLAPLTPAARHPRTNSSGIVVEGKPE